MQISLIPWETHPSFRHGNTLFLFRNMFEPYSDYINFIWICGTKQRCILSIIPLDAQFFLIRCIIWWGQNFNFVNDIGKYVYTYTLELDNAYNLKTFLLLITAIQSTEFVWIFIFYIRAGFLLQKKPRNINI